MRERIAPKIMQHNEKSSVLPEGLTGGGIVYPDLKWYANESDRKALPGRCPYEALTCECGLKYVPGEPDNDSLHAMWHDEYLNGPELFQLRALEAIDMVSGYQLFLVDANADQDIRSQLKHIAFVAQREMSDFPAGYDGTITEADQRLYIVADGDRGIAMVVTAKDEYSWRLAFNSDSTVGLLNAKALFGKRQKITRIWVAKNYRRHGIGVSLVRAVAKSLKCELADIGWELPLSSNGKKLIQKLVPSQWWGCGDANALQETLDAVN